jgi:hypothetical protein
MNLYRCFVLTASLLWLIPASAEMYQWVDSEGVTHFSQLPPPDAAQAVRTPIPRATATTLSGGALVRQQEQQKVQQMRERDTAIREEQEEARKKAAKRDAKRDVTNEKNCNAARHNYDVLEGLGRRRIRTQGGDYQRLTEEQRQQMIKEAEQMIERSCGK